MKKWSTVHQYYLRLKMLFNRENGRHMDTNDANEVLAVRSLRYLIFIVIQGC